MTATIDSASRRTYEEQGFRRLRHVLRDDELAVLCDRLGQIMSMFMNKPAGAGTFLRWRQDRWT